MESLNLSPLFSFEFNKDAAGNAHSCSYCGQWEAARWNGNYYVRYLILNFRACSECYEKIQENVMIPILQEKSEWDKKRVNLCNFYTCPKCGGNMVGDGYTIARHCENVDLPMDREPDAPLLFCSGEDLA